MRPDNMRIDMQTSDFERLKAGSVFAPAETRYELISATPPPSQASLKFIEPLKSLRPTADRHTFEVDAIGAVGELTDRDLV